MKSWFMRLTLLTLVLLSVGGLMAATQEIAGTVKDNTGGVIPGVTVVLTNVETGQVRQVLSSDEGDYLFTNIKTGIYEIRAELEGFQPMKLTGIRVSIGDRLAYPLVMTISNLTTEVEVKAEVEQVETTTSQLDTVIDEKRITDLPLNGRDPMNLVFLTPGVASGSNGYPSANGTRARSNNYQLDGVDNNDNAVLGSIVSTNVDATAEFRVITSNYSAEYGRAGGAVIDVITKSGNNEIHGNAFEFFRGENLDATSWYENLIGVEKGEYKRHQFGGSIGGPILKNKLFFFFNTEWYRYSDMIPTNCEVPTAAFRETVTNPDMAQIFNDYYPLPNNDSIQSTSENSGINSFVTNSNSTSEQATLKLDYNFSEAHVFSFRAFYNQGESNDPWSLPTTDRGTFPYKGHQYSIAMDWTWIVSPTLVNSFKVAYNRNCAGWFKSNEDFDMPFNSLDPTAPESFTTFGGYEGYDDQYRNTGTLQFKETLTWLKGDHSIKGGVDFRYLHDNSAANFGRVPIYYFDSYFTGQDYLTNVRTGLVDNLSVTIYGDGTNYISGTEDYRGWRTREYDLFVQDDWKVLSNLTLNLGARLEFKPAPFEVNNILGGFMPSDAYNNGYRMPNYNNLFDPANYTTGEVMDLYNYFWYGAGDDPVNWQGTGATSILASQGYELYNADNFNLAPRLGLSWDPFGDGKTAVRAGYGISFDRMFDNLVTWTTGQVPYSLPVFMATTLGGDGIFPDGVTYYGRGVPMPAVTTHPDPASFLDWVTIFNDDFSQPYIQTWNLSVQRELWPGNILNVTYAGSAGIHMLARGNPNQPQLSEEFIDMAMDDYGLQAFRNTMLGYMARRYMVPNTQFMITSYIDQYAQSNYHSLQTSFNHQFQDGLQFAINYTYSKAFDNASELVSYDSTGGTVFATDWWDKSYDRGYANFDARHIFNTNFIFELPFGPGKWIGGDTEGVVGALLGGWQINSIVSANSGAPLDYRYAMDTLGIGGRSAVRPDVASYSFVTTGNRVGPTATSFSLASGSAIYGLYNFRHPKGNYYRGYFRGPGYWNVDFSMFKEVKTPWVGSEQAKIQFRMEAYNLFNHTNFGNPNLSLTSANLGYTYTTYSARQIQLGLKFIF